MESHLWSTIKPLLPQGWKAQRIEARYPKGVPDVCWSTPQGITGWLELKHDDGKLRAEQAIWVRNWPRSWVLCEWSGELFLVPGVAMPLNRVIPREPEFQIPSFSWHDLRG